MTPYADLYGPGGSYGMALNADIPLLSSAMAARSQFDDDEWSRPIRFPLSAGSMFMLHYDEVGLHTIYFFHMFNHKARWM